MTSICADSMLCRRRGMTLIYVTVCFALLCGIVSFAIDLGRVQAAKTELQRAADAAARYAVTGIADNTARTKAIAAAAGNYADGSTVVLRNGDVSIGTWAS